MKYFLTSFLILLASASFAAEPIVSNVRASQIADTKQVDIYYDLYDADGDSMTISIQVNDADVEIPTSSFTGDVGEGITSGNNKHVVWDAGTDWNGMFSDTVRIGVAASDNGEDPPPSGMVRIPHGINEGADPDFGGYSLTIPEDLWTGQTEVTQFQYGVVRGWGIENGYTIEAGAGTADNHPIHSINWYDCIKWCNAKSEMEGLTPCYTFGGTIYRTGNTAPTCNFNANGYRLPTDIEWEYAARGGLRSKRYPWGDSISSSNAKYESSGTAVAGSYPSNGYGLSDVSGNVWEWCWDTVGADRLLKGGSWNDTSGNLRCGARSWYPPSNTSQHVGFRIVRNVSN